MSSLSFALLCILFFPLTLSHHMVFEEIGEMAGALSYIHAIVPINISGLAHAVQNFRHDIQALKTLYSEIRQPTGSNFDDWFHQRIVDLFQLASSDAEAMHSNINSLRDTLAPITGETHLPHEEHDYQIRCLSPFAIVSGVIGTLMGWFTQHHLNILRDHLDEVQDQQNSHSSYTATAAGLNRCRCPGPGTPPGLIIAHWTTLARSYSSICTS
jgi:hypothetical protein